MAADSRSTTVASVLIVCGWVGWTVVATALLVASPISLTIIRCVTPLALVVAVVARSPWPTLASIIAIVASLVPTFTDTMVDGGSYGRETRFALRTPVPQYAPAAVAWTMWVGTLIAGALSCAAGNFPVGIPALAGGVVLSLRTPRHLHRLSRRWLVIVPNGVVVHDHMVLAETVMVRSGDISMITEAARAGDEADLTGGVLGRRVVIALTRPDKVVLSAIAARTLGTTEALHVLSFAVAPRRPSAVLRTVSK